jgi:hypothetical protein
MVVVPSVLGAASEEGGSDLLRAHFGDVPASKSRCQVFLHRGERFTTERRTAPSDEPGADALRGLHTTSAPDSLFALLPLYLSASPSALAAAWRGASEAQSSGLAA